MPRGDHALRGFRLQAISSFVFPAVPRPPIGCLTFSDRLISPVFRTAYIYESMTIAEAKKIGGGQGLICAVTGIAIAQVMMTLLVSTDAGFMKGFFWFIGLGMDVNIIVGILIMILCGYVYGRIAGVQIIVKNRNFIGVGIICSVAILLTTAILCGWTGFFQEGLSDIGTGDDPFEDYIIKPFAWVATVGIIPAVLIGMWVGGRIKRRGRKRS